MTNPKEEAMKHTIRWFGIVPGGERVPRNRHMNGGDWGWEANCSCGWQTRTGGAIQERIREYVEDHKHDRFEQTNTGRT